jgi:hypothetical protein
MVDDDLRAGQAERVHFSYLTSVAGGLVTAANSLDEHVAHLAAILAGDRSFAAKSDRFAKAFLWPPFPYRSPVKAFQRAVERLAWGKEPRLLRNVILPFLLRPVADYASRHIDSRQDVAKDSTEPETA